MDRSLLNLAALAVHLIRYRFLLFAGLIPFALGQAVALQKSATFNLTTFIIACAGLTFVLIGVEAFNEYFDARIGTDRVFSLEREEVPHSTFFTGLAGFAAAAIVMAFLTHSKGWPVAAFAAVGAFAACFYVTPPVKLAYRGLGELAIMISYGPMMTAGSFFIQAGRVSIAPFAASIVPALLILGVTVINEIPDFYGDRIVGKRNITVRLGRIGAIRLYGIANFVCFHFIIMGVIFKILPTAALLAALPLPLAIRNFTIANRNIDNPMAFIPAIRGAIFVYSLSTALLGLAYLI